MSANWTFLPFGYFVSVAIETPILMAGLSKDLSLPQRLFCGFWLTACTYPIVILVLPELLASSPRGSYILVAEVFAPVSECALFWLAFHQGRGLGRKTLARNLGVIILANLLSFLGGELLNSAHWLGWF